MNAMMKSIWLAGATALVMAGCTTTQPTETATGATKKLVRTGVYVGKGPYGSGCCEWVRMLNQAPEISLTLLDEEAVQNGALDKLDLLVMPGGSSPAIKRGLGTNGTERIKAFIRKGGGYLGTCAGCCLLMDPVYDQSRGIGVIPFYRAGSKGQTKLSVKLTPAGQKALGLSENIYGLRYSHGPVLEPSTNSFPESKFEVWGVNNADFMKPGSKPEMMGRAALIGGTFGKGRVFVTSCHPEYYASTREVLQGAFKWVTGVTMSQPPRPRSPRALTVGFFADEINSIEAQRTLLAIENDPAYDLLPITDGEVLEGKIEHLDVLVFPNGWKYGLGKSVKKSIAAFAERGGKSFAWGTGTAVLPKGGVACASGEDVLKKLKQVK